MKIFFVLFALVAVTLAAYPFLNQSEEPETLTGLPWQIEILDDGSTKIFGLQPGKSLLSDALKILGADMDMAIITASGELANDDAGNYNIGSLEMYYGHYKAGLLSGKLVLQSNASEQDIKRWRENSPKFDYMPTGLAKKHLLLDSDLEQALEKTIISLTFIPAVNLDEEVILARFGQPDQRVELAGVIHFLYPKKGLDIALHEESKEVLQYVAPDAFQKLIQPLSKSVQ